MHLKNKKIKYLVIQNVASIKWLYSTGASHSLSHILSPSPTSTRILSQNKFPVWQKYKTSSLPATGVSWKERKWRGGEELAHGPLSQPPHHSLGSQVLHHPTGTAAPLPHSTWTLPTFSPHTLWFFPLIIRLFPNIIIIIVWVLQLAHHPLLH